MSVTLEELVKALQHENIRNIKNQNPDESFDRTRTFIINKKYYEIEWYCNNCYLKHGDMIILFNHIKQSNTWPNNGKMNLQFYDSNYNVCCFIKIEDWPVKK